MNSKEALEFINKLFDENGKRILDEVEEKLFLGFWEGKTYDEISIEANRANQSLREKGANLCKKITEDLGIKVTKKNFKQPIEFKYQQLPKVIPSQESPLPVNEEISKPTELLQQPSDLFRREYPIINPFIPQNGRIEDPQQFFGREQEMRLVFEVLNSGSSVALIGDEGIGKSSLLWAICREAKSRLQLPRQPVFLDLNGIDNENDFYKALCHEVGIPESTGFVLSRNLRSHERKVLLALDNVGKLTWQGFTRQVRDKLRSFAEGGDAPLKLILAATEPLNDLFNDSQDEGKTSPLAGICYEVHIKPWDETTMRAFLVNRLAKTSVSFTEEKTVQLLHSSCGHPRKLVQLCYRTFSQYMEGMQ